MRNLFVMAVTTLFFMSSIFGCSNGTPLPALDPDMIMINLDLEVTDKAKESFSPEKLALYNAIRLKQPVSHKLITKLLSEEHRKEYNQRKSAEIGSSHVDKMVQMLSSVENKNLADLDHLTGLKESYENKLTEHLLSKGINDGIRYFHQAVSVLDIEQEGLMQCYSGTVLNQLVTRHLRSGVDFQAGNHVVIFESGHVLPGFVMKGANHFRLYGIETTASGDGIIDFGYTHQMKDLDIEVVQVVDASEFAVIEIYKFGLKDSEKVAKQAIENAKKKYNIVSKELSGVRIHPDLSLEEENSQKLLNSSPLAFGRYEVTDEMKKPSERKPVSSATRGKVTFMSPSDFKSMTETKAQVARSENRDEEALKADPLVELAPRFIGIYRVSRQTKELPEVDRDSDMFFNVKPDGSATLMIFRFAYSLAGSPNLDTEKLDKYTRAIRIEFVAKVQEKMIELENSYFSSAENPIVEERKVRLVSFHLKPGERKRLTNKGFFNLDLIVNPELFKKLSFESEYPSGLERFVPEDAPYSIHKACCGDSFFEMTKEVRKHINPHATEEVIHVGEREVRHYYFDLDATSSEE